MRDLARRNYLIAAELFAAYGGNIDLCDPWICGLGEDTVGGGELGELFSTVIADQFQRFTDGDRFFYLNDPDVRDSAILATGINVEILSPLPMSSTPTPSEELDPMP
jgi:hypothetical protein